MSRNKKIAIVYDWIDKWGGVERALLALREMFPEAIFFTSYYDPEKAAWAKDLNIKTSFIQQLPSFIRRSRIASLPFYPYAFEQMDFSGYDLVISVTSSFAKSIITKPGTFHLSYLLTPTRFLWVKQDDYLKNKLIKTMLSPYLTKLRNWDFIAGQRPDKIISISRTVAERCKKYYQRESDVIYPPFDIEYWKKIKEDSKYPASQRGEQKPNLQVKRQDYFLVVSRLESYKKVDLILRSINHSKINRLIVVGEGSQFYNLKNIASEKVIFLNRLSDEELGHLYSNAEALIMAQEEDFGYVALEAQFFGCPIIAYQKGGATETVIDGKSGIFFAEQKVKSIQTAIERFHLLKYKLKNNLKSQGELNTEKFSKKKFKVDLQNLLNNL